jgi:hypothetical protein
MRNRTLAFTFILASAVAANSAAAQQWSTLAAAEDGFSVDLPGTAQRQNLDVDAQVMNSNRQYLLDQGAVAWIVTSVYFKKQVAEEGFVNAVVDAVKAGCEIRDERRTSYPGGLTSDFVLQKCAEGRSMRVRVYAHGDRLYQALVVGPAGIEEKSETRRFFDSFKLTQAVPPAPVASPPPVAAAPLQWQTVTSVEDGFSVEFPGTPEASQGKLNPEREISDRRWAVSDGQVAWLVGSVHYKSALELEPAINGIVSGMKGPCEIHDERRTAYPGGISTDFVLHKCPDGTVMRARTYVQGDRLYQAMVVGQAAVDARPETKRFFDSFRLTTRPAVAAAPPAAAPSRSDQAGSAAAGIVQPRGPAVAAAPPSGGGRQGGPADDRNWGALAVDITDRELPGGSGEAGTEREAINNAMKYCRQDGGKACKLVLTFRKCGAYAHFRSDGATGMGETKRAAESAALAACKDNRCKIVVSECNDD